MALQLARSDLHHEFWQGNGSIGGWHDIKKEYNAVSSEEQALFDVEMYMDLCEQLTSLSMIKKQLVHPLVFQAMGWLERATTLHLRKVSRRVAMQCHLVGQCVYLQMAGGMADADSGGVSTWQCFVAGCTDCNSV